MNTPDARIVDLYNFKCLHLFAVFTAIYIALSFLTNAFVFTDDLFYSSLNNQIETGRIAHLIDLARRMQWVSYLLPPFLLTLKWSIISGAIYATMLLNNDKVLFSSCMKITALAEIAMLLASFVKTAYLLFLPPSDLTEVQLFYPCSLTQFFNKELLPSYVQYPLQQVNLFEALYWFLLIYGVKILFNKSLKQAFAIVLLGYGTLLTFWILMVMFLHLQTT